MNQLNLSPDTIVSRNRIVYAQDGHMEHAASFGPVLSLKQWDYYLQSHGGLGGITNRQGVLVSLRLRNGAIYLNN